MGMGHVGQGYMKKGKTISQTISHITHDLIVVYYSGGYSEVVGRMAEDSMNNAVIEVKALPDYATKGEVCVASSIY